MHARILSCMKVRIVLLMMALSKSSSIFRDATMTKTSGVIDRKRKGVEIGTTPPSFDNDIDIDTCTCSGDLIARQQEGKRVAAPKNIRFILPLSVHVKLDLWQSLDGLLVDVNE